ncbi:MAG: hypothetical protein IH586_22390, partial [Anaerolineaceae bacterium]|nr:hypothetical protein [Anaerolineaceae bacterium]
MMRITNRMITEHAITHMSESLEQLHSLQEKNSTQKKFANASDDPLAASLSLSLKSTLNTIGDYGKTVDLAKDWMSANEIAFQKAEELSTSATTLISRALNDTFGAGERANAFAEDLNGIIREAVDAVNTSHNGQYIFAGIQVGQPGPPYSIPNNTTPVPTLNAAINGTVQRTIGPGKSITLNFHADDAFGAFFQTLVDARDALLNNDTNALRTSLTALQSNLNLLDQNRTLNGARMRQAEVAQDYLEKTRIETESLISQNEDINLA